MKDEKDTGFTPLGISRKQSVIMAQYILSAAKGHVVAVPEHDSTVPHWNAINPTFVSVGEKTLKGAGLVKEQIDVLRRINHPLDPNLYDGPEGDRFVFMLNGLEKAAGVSQAMAKKYAELFKRNSETGIFQGIRRR